MASSLPEVWEKKGHQEIPQILLRAMSDLLQRNKNWLPAICYPNRIQAPVINRRDSSHGAARFPLPSPPPGISISPIPTTYRRKAK